MDVLVLTGKKSQLLWEQILTCIQHEHVTFIMGNLDLPLQQQVMTKGLLIAEDALVPHDERKRLRRQCFDILYFHPSELEDREQFLQKIERFIAIKRHMIAYEKMNHRFMPLLILCTITSMLFGSSELTYMFISIFEVYVLASVLYALVIRFLYASRRKKES